MSLSSLRSSQQLNLGRWSVLRRISEQRMRDAQLGRYACITELQAGTTTHHNNDGVMVQIHAGNVEEVRRRSELYQREEQLAQEEMTAWRSCLTVAWRAYNDSCLVTARLAVAQRSHDELQALKAEGVREQSKAACEFAAKESQRGRPLAVCHAMNAPNGVSVNETELLSAAMTTKRADTT